MLPLSLKMSVTKTVQDLKTSLAKQLPCDTPERTEQARDILHRLDECNMTLPILSDTLVGTVVSKFKSHSQLGDVAKSLIKKWKQMAKQQQQQQQQQPPAVRQMSMGASSVASSSTTTAAVPEITTDEWADLPLLRRNIRSKLLSILKLSKKSTLTEGKDDDEAKFSHEQLCVSRSNDIEEAMYTLCGGTDGDAYKEKARTLCFNLKKNELLRNQVLRKRLSATELVTMSSDQLATTEQQVEREETTKKLQDSRRLDWEQANEDKINEMCGIKGDLLKASLFTCGRCKSIKTTSTQKQTRSADEPMTVFVLCMNCGNRWKC